MEENNGNIRFLSAISYIGILFVIGHFAVEKDNPDLRFHTFQGGVLFALISVAYFCDFLIYVVLNFVPEIDMIITLLLTVGISVSYLMLMAMGMYHALRFEQKLLPFIGSAAVTLRTKMDHR